MTGPALMMFHPETKRVPAAIGDDLDAKGIVNTTAIATNSAAVTRPAIVPTPSHEGQNRTQTNRHHGGRPARFSSAAMVRQLISISQPTS